VLEQERRPGPEELWIMLENTELIPRQV